MDVAVSYSFWGYVALVLLALPFVLAGIKHITGHAGMVGYAKSVGQPIPILAGVPAGLALLAGAVGLFFTNVLAVWGAGLLILFLVLATLQYHKDWKNDTGFGKNLALIGALAYLIVSVVK